MVLHRRHRGTQKVLLAAPHPGPEAGDRSVRPAPPHRGVRAVSEFGRPSVSAGITARRQIVRILTLELEDEQAELLEREAQRRGTTINEVVAQLLSSLSLSVGCDVTQDPIYNIKSHAS